MTAAIEFGGVSKTYNRAFSSEGVEALREVSFTVSPGEVCAFLGPNGAGKTTSIAILMGFLFPEAGEVQVLGYGPGDVRAKAQIGFLPENFAFQKFLTGPKLLALHLQLSGRRVPDPFRLTASVFARVQLAGYESLRIGKYSRGMVQRLGIAQALIGDPQLLIFDEPTSGLDPVGRKDVLDLVHSLKQAGKTVFFSSHILPEVQQICDRVVIINRGRLVRSGRMDEIVRAGSRVEIIIDRLPDDAARIAVQQGAAIDDKAGNGIRILVESDRQRAVLETLWSAGCEVLRVNPLEESLEQVFLKLVGGNS